LTSRREESADVEAVEEALDLRVDLLVVVVAAVEAVAAVKILVAHAPAEEHVVHAVHVHPGVADQLVLAEDAVIQVEVVDRQVIERVVAAVLDQGARAERQILVDALARVAADLLELPLEALDAGPRGGAGVLLPARLVGADGGTEQARTECGCGSVHNVLPGRLHGPDRPALIRPLVAGHRTGGRC
jgi:hypothetical protein